MAEMGMRVAGGSRAMDALVFFDRPGNSGWAVAGKMFVTSRREIPDISMDGIFCVSKIFLSTNLIFFGTSAQKISISLVRGAFVTWV